MGLLRRILIAADKEPMKGQNEVDETTSDEIQVAFDILGKRIGTAR